MSLNSTYFGSILTLQDALLILEGIRYNLLPQVKRRLNDAEKQQITAGYIFAWNETQSGMKRWTDGRTWSPSKVKGPFLLYRELKEDRTEKENGLVKQSFSLTSRNNEKLHLIAYYRYQDRISGVFIGKIPSLDPLFVRCQFDNTIFEEGFSSYHLNRRDKSGGFNLYSAHNSSEIQLPAISPPNQFNPSFQLKNSSIPPSGPFDDQSVQPRYSMCYSQPVPCNFFYGHQYNTAGQTFYHTDKSDMHPSQVYQQLHRPTPFSVFPDALQRRTAILLGKTRNRSFKHGSQVSSKKSSHKKPVLDHCLADALAKACSRDIASSNYIPIQSCMKMQRTSSTNHKGEAVSITTNLNTRVVSDRSNATTDRAELDEIDKNGSPSTTSKESTPRQKFSPP